MKCPGKRRKNIQILNGYLTSPRQDQTNKITIRLAEAIKLQYWLSRSRSDRTSQSRRIDSRSKDTEKLTSRVTHTKTMSQTPQAHSLASIWLWWKERKGLGLKLKTPRQRRKPIRNVCNYDVYSRLNRFGNQFDKRYCLSSEKYYTTEVHETYEIHETDEHGWFMTWKP